MFYFFSFFFIFSLDSFWQRIFSSFSLLVVDSSSSSWRGTFSSGKFFFLNLFFLLAIEFEISALSSFSFRGGFFLARHFLFRQVFFSSLSLFLIFDRIGNIGALFFLFQWWILLLDEALSLQASFFFLSISFSHFR